jgi:IS4 transposase
LGEDDKNKFDLIPYLDEQKDNIIEFKEIYIGKDERLKCRMICYRLPKDVADTRIRKKRAEYKKKGLNPPSKELLANLRYAIFITNIPKEKVSAEMIGTLYKIRWQIELIFKEFKSLMNIDVMQGQKETSINTFIYGQLINILVITDVKRLAILYAKKVNRELSFVKLIQHLKYNQNLEKAILNGNILELLEEIERDIVKFCKTKRKRKTSRQLLEENMGFLETFL